MKKIAILCFVLGIFSHWFFSGGSGPQGPIEISDGDYRIYHIQNAYDTETRERIYWLIAQRVKVERVNDLPIPVQVGKVNFYQILRRVIENLPDDGKPIDKSLSFLAIKKGKAKIEKMTWPPTVITR